ncbi:MAG: TetR/AcrR family transcriptional regulator [Pseudomonas sp.]|nr:TetR/AcrR family transcriptional regulator [Pseudomonas sp.]
MKDHRVKVAAQRREKTRLKLLESALSVLYEKGPDNVVTDDFIVAAGVSRGTFYNHFDTTNDLILALASAMSDEFVAAVNDYILTCKSPLERLAAGTRLYMQMTLRFPIWGTFLSRLGARIAVRAQPIEHYITRDLTDAVDQGLIQVADVLAARDMVIGGIFYGIGTMAAEPTHADHPQHLMEAILRGLRAPEALIPSLAYGPLPTLSPMNGPLFSKLKPENLGDN